MYNNYKSLLRIQLNKVGRNDIYFKIENEWLEFFRNFAAEYLRSDEAELIEIRFIEQVCRFVYKLSHGDAKLQVFDEFNSCEKMNHALSYVNELTEDDVKKIETVMDSIQSMGNLDNYSCEDFWYEFMGIRVSSYPNDYVYIPDIRGHIEPSHLKKEESDYLSRFIWSLSDTSRIFLRVYYRYHSNIKPDFLRKIYDDDYIISDILRKKLNLPMEENYMQYNGNGRVEYEKQYYVEDMYGNRYPAGEMYEDQYSAEKIKRYSVREMYENGYFGDEEEEKCNKIFLFGGYHNKIITIFDNYEKEIPAYYVSNITDVIEADVIEADVKETDVKAKTIIRPTFLRQKAQDYPTAWPCFALVDVGCRYDDNTSSNVIPLSFCVDYEGHESFSCREEYNVLCYYHADWCINVWVNGEYYEEPLTNRSAYVFTNAAKRFLEEKTRNDEIRKYFEENYYEGIDLDSIEDSEIRKKKLARKEADEKAYRKFVERTVELEGDQNARYLYFLKEQEKSDVEQLLAGFKRPESFNEVLNRLVDNYQERRTRKDDPSYERDSDLCKATRIPDYTLCKMRAGKTERTDRDNLWALAMVLYLSVFETEELFNTFSMTIKKVINKREGLIKAIIEKNENLDKDHKWDLDKVNEALNLGGFEGIGYKRRSNNDTNNENNRSKPLKAFE